MTSIKPSREPDHATIKICDNNPFRYCTQNRSWPNLLTDGYALTSLKCVGQVMMMMMMVMMMIIIMVMGYVVIEFSIFYSKIDIFNIVCGTHILTISSLSK